MSHSLARRLWLASLLAACGTDNKAEPAAPKGQAIDPALLERSWQVRLSDATARAPFEAHPGWGGVFQRAYEQALPALWDKF